MDTLTVEVVEGASEVDPQDWDPLVGAEDASPFVEWRFLQSLERAGTIQAQTGWIPRFPVVKRGPKVIAAAPAYIKLHSQGEFVFDFAWADLCHRLGIEYYPKLLVGVPFTPVTGPRLLVHPDEDPVALRRSLAEVLMEMCRAMELSSVHVNFTSPEEADALAEAGFMRRFGLQYHWSRQGQTSFDEYLGRFNSKRRNQLKRERRELEKQGVTIRTLGGEALCGKARLAFRLYRSTVDKFFWGRRYLTEKAFEVWTQELQDTLRLVVAETASGEVVAGAVNFEKGSRLYGRYWGCFRELRHLHFNVCYYHGVQECLEKGLDVFEPGAGGEHKRVRGFEPTLMHSAHYVRDPRVHDLIARHLEAEREAVVREREAMLEELA
ncbi:MAG: GNAT family N-acetyltransferase [Myxococcota bacterium]